MTQIKSLPPFAMVPDEIALTQEYALSLQNLKEFPPVQQSLLKEIEMVFESHAGHDPFWTIEAMRADPDWQKARELAKELMVKLADVQLQEPMRAAVSVPASPAPKAGFFAKLKRLFGRKSA